MRFTKELLYPKIIFILALSCLCNITEGQSLKYAPRSQKNKGKVKKINTYQYHPSLFDTINISSKLEKESRHVSSQEFDKESGNLVHIEKYDLSFDDNSTADFVYDENDNLLMSFSFHPLRDRDTTWYEYDYENLIIVRTTSRKTTGFFQGEMKEIQSLRHIFDLNYNKVGMESIGTENELLLYQKYHYDEDNKLVLLQNYEGIQLENSNLYKYDKLNRKKVIQTMDRNGDLVRKSSYYYSKNGYTISNYKKDGSLRDRHSVIQFKDKQNNIIKEYNFNIDTKKTVVIEYRIEYF